MEDLPKYTDEESWVVLEKLGNNISFDKIEKMPYRLRVLLSEDVIDYNENNIEIYEFETKREVNSQKIKAYHDLVKKREGKTKKRFEIDKFMNEEEKTDYDSLLLKREKIKMGLDYHKRLKERQGFTLNEKARDYLKRFDQEKEKKLAHNYTQNLRTVGMKF